MSRNGWNGQPARVGGLPAHPVREFGYPRFGERFSGAGLGGKLPPRTARLAVPLRANCIELDERLDYLIS